MITFIKDFRTILDTGGGTLCVLLFSQSNVDLAQRGFMYNSFGNGWHSRYLVEQELRFINYSQELFEPQQRT